MENTHCPFRIRRWDIWLFLAEPCGFSLSCLSVGLRWNMCWICTHNFGVHGISCILQDWPRHHTVQRALTPAVKNKMRINGKLRNQYYSKHLSSLNVGSTGPLALLSLTYDTHIGLNKDALCLVGLWIIFIPNTGLKFRLVWVDNRSPM